MHHIYHTEAFVLGSRSFGEDSKTLVLYTKELGLVHARAQAVRKLTSKLKYTLQDFSYAQVDLVRGKEIWRITTAVPIDSLYEVRKNIDTDEVFARLCSLVARLCTGEDQNTEVFSVLIDASEMLKVRSASKEALRNTEIFCVARILIALGYLDRALIPTVSQNTTCVPDIFLNDEIKKTILQKINQALREAQL
jgi:DNA repair protein RecO